MKGIPLLIFLFLSVPALAQNTGGKTGIIDYGNPSLLLVPASAGAVQDKWSIWPGFREMAFSEDEETVYIKNPENYIFSRQPEKRTLYGWNLISQKKEGFDVSQLPLSRKGRGILSLFTPHYPLPAFRGGKKGRLDNSCWISADLKLTLTDNFAVTITDTTGKQTAAFTVPDYFAGVSPEAFKSLKTKPKDYDIDFTFCYYPNSNNLYISGDCGKYGKGNNRLWRYQLGTGILSEIPFFTTTSWAKDNGFTTFGKAAVSFVGDYIIRQYFTEYQQIHYEFISAAEGRLVAKGQLQTGAYEGQDNRVLAFLPGLNQVVILNHNLETDIAKRRYRIDFYDSTLSRLSKSVVLDIGKADISGSTDELPVCISKQGKFFAFAGMYIHPEIGCYLSVNFDLLQDAGLGYINSINDNSIHAPLIEANYATADFTRVQAALEVKNKEIEKLKAHAGLLLKSIKEKNDKLLALYNQNRLDELLVNGDIWKIDPVRFEWSVPAPQGVLNGPTPYSFGVSYKVTYRQSPVSVNYVDMQCTEVAEAYRDYSLKNREEKIYGESYFKPSGNSHTLIRNANYRYGNPYMTYDKPELQTYMGYLERASDLFTGNSFEITTQNQLGIPVVVLKYPLKNDTNKAVYLYQQEILEWLHNYNSDMAEMKKLTEEVKKIGQ